MKKLILILTVIFISSAGFSQANQKLEYQFYTTDFTIITSDDTITFTAKYICERERKSLKNEYSKARMLFDYRVEEYVDGEYYESGYLMPNSLRFKQGMLYKYDGIFYDLDTIVQIYHSDGWKDFKKVFLKRGLKGKWIK